MSLEPTTAAQAVRADELPVGLVSRPRINTLLSAGDPTVTCVVAPAGYGKSTAVLDWRTGPDVCGRRFASLELDSRDNDPVRFWTRLLDASSDLGVELGDEVGGLLRDEVRSAPQHAPDAFIVALTGALEGLAERAVLVLDDLQAITNGAVLEALRMLVEALPRTLQVVLVSRAALSGLALHRFRLSGRLSEVGPTDLAFTPAETTQLLASLAAPGDVASIDVEALTSGTDGWVTGLRYAAISIRDGAIHGDLVRGLSLPNHDVSQFLLGEVFNSQPASRKTFLLTVSVLDVLTATSCDFLTGRSDAAHLLRDLEQAGAFVTPLDRERRHYRILGVFRDFLRHHLETTSPSRAAAVHELASRWFERSGDAVAAIDHALLAGAHQRAAELMTAQVADLHSRGLDDTIRRWFDAVPEAVLASLPRLAVTNAWLLLQRGLPSAAIAWCQRADEQGARRPEGDSDVEVQSACVRAFAYRVLGNLEATFEWGATAQQSLDARERSHRRTDSFARLAMTDAVAEAFALAGRPEAGIEFVRKNLNRTLDGENVFATVSLPGQLATLSSMVGGLDEAAKYAARSLEEAARHGLGNMPPAADALVALGELHWERDELDRSASAFEAAIDAVRTSPRFWIHARALLGLAKCRSAQRQYDDALSILEVAERLYPWGAPPEFFSAQVIERRLLLAARQRDAHDARRWFRELSVLPVPAHRLAHLDAVVSLLEGRSRSMKDVGWTRAYDGSPNRRWALELAVLRLRIGAANGDPGVGEHLTEVLQRGESQHFVRTVIGQDARLIHIGLRGLRGDPARTATVSPGYLDELESAISRELQGPTMQGLEVHDPAGTSTGAPSPRPPELLSAGELAVVEYLPTDLTYAEIAARRFVSVNTVKSQLKSIYRKLGTTTRAGAAERCRRLGLLP